MPQMNISNFFKILKSEKNKNFEFIILTSSKEEQNKVNIFNMDIAGYIIKPTINKKFVDDVRTRNLN
jgi:DNA-binding response OmpR family regulator